MADASYLNTTQLSSLLDQVFGPGKWRETGGYRSPEREDQLRAQGAATVPVGHTSEHSLGTDDAPGAVDLVVAGMTPQQAAAALQRAKAPFSEYIPEGSAGTQGAHLHVGYRQGGKTVSASVPGLAGGGSLPGVLQQALANDPGYQGVLGAQATSVKDAAATKAALDSAQKQIADIKAKTDDLGSAKPPDVPTLPDEQQFKDKELGAVSKKPMDPTRALGQFLPMLAILGGAFTKNGAIGSLQAATAAMNAAKANDKDALDRAHNDWLDKTTQLTNQYKLEQDAFGDAIQKNGNDRANLSAELSVIAAQYNIPLLKQQVDSGDLDGAYKTIQSRTAALAPILELREQAVANEFKRAQLGIEADKIPLATQIYTDYLSKHPGDTKGALTAAGEAAGALKVGAEAKVDDHIRSELAKSDVGKWYSTVRDKTQILNDASSDKIRDGTVRGAAVTDAYQQIINGGKALRGFQFNLLLDHAGLADKAAVLEKQIGRGGPVSDQMLKDMKDVAAVVSGDVSQQYEDAITRAKKVALIEGSQDPDNVVPFDVPAGGPGAGASSDAPPAAGGNQKTYRLGDIVVHGGKKYKVVGGDPTDPDVEPVTP